MSIDIGQNKDFFQQLFDQADDSFSRSHVSRKSSFQDSSEIMGGTPDESFEEPRVALLP